VAVSYEEITKKNCSFDAGQYFEITLNYIDLSLDEFTSELSKRQSNLAECFCEGNRLEKSISKALGTLNYERLD